MESYSHEIQKVVDAYAAEMKSGGTYEVEYASGPHRFIVRSKCYHEAEMVARRQAQDFSERMREAAR